MEIHVEQTGHDLVVSVEGRPNRLILCQVLEELGGKCAQIAGADFLLTSVETGDDRIATVLENGISRTDRG